MDQSGLIKNDEAASLSS